MKALEGDEENAYNAQEASPGGRRRSRPMSASTPRSGSGGRHAAASRSRVGAADRRRRGGRVGARRAIADIGRRERWHRPVRSGTLRAVIFGVSDGLVSNLSLVMGVAGAVGRSPQFVLLAGIAGLLAGAFSMAAGEYISMQSQRELFERQIALERAEMEAMPEEEEAELAAAYRARASPRDEATRIAHRIFQDPEAALDMLVREELGLDPDELGSPWGAAGGSFVAFARRGRHPGHPVPLRRRAAVTAISLGASLVALFAVGAGVSLLTGRSLVFSGLRQLGIGLGAAVVTYLIGSAHRRRGRADPMGEATLLRERLVGEGLDPGAWSNGPGRPLRGPRPCLRQGHRRDVRLHHLRPRRRSRGTGDRRPARAARRHQPRRRCRARRRRLPRGPSPGRHIQRRHTARGRIVVSRGARNRSATRGRIR